VAKDFIVGLSNALNIPSSPGAILRVTKVPGFTYTISGATTTTNGTPVQNSSWTIDNTQAGFLVLTLNSSIPGFGQSLVGFTITRTAAAPGTLGNITATLQNGTGGDTVTSDNTVFLQINAQ
jgi:hypothetical protein